MNRDFEKRLMELAQRADKESRYVFTGFLNLEEKSQALALLRTYPKAVICSFFGGYEGAEREMLAFYPDYYREEEIPWPIKILRISPLNLKFSDTLRHRDILGATLNLGIDRSFTGDILVKNNVSYLFAEEGMGDFIQRNLTKVKHTFVKVERIEKMEEDINPEIKEWDLILTSLRLDSLVSGVYRLSRKEGTELVKEEKVYVDGKLSSSASLEVKPSQIISVSHKGRFYYSFENKITKSGRIVVKIHQWI